MCAAAEEYPGCADLLDSYCEVHLVARPASLRGVATGVALAQSDVLVMDESTLAREGVQAVQSVHATFPALNILLVYEKDNNYNVMEYLSIGVRGLIERKSCLHLLRRAIPALYSGEVWMPRELVQSLRKQAPVPSDRSFWVILPSTMPDRGRLN